MTSIKRHRRSKTEQAKLAANVRRAEWLAERERGLDPRNRARSLNGNDAISPIAKFSDEDGPGITTYFNR